MKRFKTASQIKAAVVGYGASFSMGRHHLNEMKRAGMTPVAMADIDPTRLPVAAADFPGIRTFPSLGALLKGTEVDLVAMITPHSTHAPLALEALRAGRHVVCEKPFAVTTAECDRMIATAKKHGTVLSTYHNRHWDGCILAALKQVRSGLIGDAYRVEAHVGGHGQPGDWWRTSKTISGGILYDWGVHLLEYSLQILASDILEVSGVAHTGYWAPRTAWKEDTHEDEGMAVVRFANGKWLTLNVSCLDSHPKRGMVEVTGTKGTLIMEGSHNEVITHDGPHVITTRYKNPDSEGWRFYQNIADHLVGGAKLAITPEWARRPIHIIDLANRSARLGRALRAKYA
jgi:scyllo-inositol 2-dehydrogenase (NADP+)